jgi:ABC-type lipoprotein export system ATPase subunit
VVRSDAPVILETHGLIKEYKVGHQQVGAIRDVSVTVHQGEFIAITGPSGSGKSTLLQLMGGLERPSSGTVSVDGVRLDTMSDRALSRFRGQFIGFVFQFFYLQPFLNVGTNLAVPGMFSRLKGQERSERVRELAEAVGLADRLDHMPSQLSGGQIQRAAIARALMNRPKLLLADEPTGNLDSQNGMAIVQLFEKIRDEFGTTIVLVTHDPAVARRADRSIVLKDGVVV